MSEPGRGGLTDAERENLKSLARYALAIFAAVSLTLIAPRSSRTQVERIPAGEAAPASSRVSQPCQPRLRNASPSNRPQSRHPSM